MGDEIEDGIEVVGIILKIKGQEVTLDVDAAEKTIKTMERLLGLTKQNDVLNPYDLEKARRQMQLQPSPYQNLAWASGAASTAIKSAAGAIAGMDHARGIRGK